MLNDCSGPNPIKKKGTKHTGCRTPLSTSTRFDKKRGKAGSIGKAGDGFISDEISTRKAVNQEGQGVFDRCILFWFMLPRESAVFLEKANLIFRFFGVLLFQFKHVFRFLREP